LGIGELLIMKIRLIKTYAGTFKVQFRKDWRDGWITALANNDKYPIGREYHGDGSTHAGTFVSEANAIDFIDVLKNRILLEENEHKYEVKKIIKF
jgi:hypothetical protein